MKLIKKGIVKNWTDVCNVPLHTKVAVMKHVFETCSWPMHALPSTQSNPCNHRITYICIGFSVGWMKPIKECCLQYASLHKCSGIWSATGLISATCSWSMDTLSSTQSNLCNYRNNFIRIGFMWCIRWNLSENELLKIGPLSATALSMWWNSNMCEASCPRRVRDSYMHCPQHYQFLATTGLILAIWGGSLLQSDCCLQHASPHKCAGNQTCIGLHALSSTLWHFHKIPCF